MSRRFAFFMAGLILLACGAALTVLPARWVMAMVPEALPLSVVDASGTIWSGSATMAIGVFPHRRTIPEPLRWRLSFSNGPRLLLSHPWLGGPLTLAPAWLGVGVSAQTLQLPATVLSTLDARIAAIGPGGELSLKWPAMFIGRSGRPAGSPLLDVQWLNAVSALTPIRPMGTYTLALKQGASGGSDLTLSTQLGPLILKGTGVLDRKNGFQFDGTAQADPAENASVQAALHDLLATLGPRQNNQTHLRFR